MTSSLPSSPTPSSPSFAASPAFSTLSEATFTSNNNAHTLLPSHQPTRSKSESIVEQLVKEREAECAPEGADEEAQRLDEKLRQMNLDAEGGGEQECGCASPTSPEVEGGAFEGLGGSQVENNGEMDEKNGLSPPKFRKTSPRQSRDANTEGTGDFDRFSLPALEAIKAASECRVVGESGETITFGDLVKSRGRVVVVFLRHLWCGLCAQYVTALRRATTALASASSTTVSTASDQSPPLYILLISSGSPSLIPIYRSRLDCPFPLYVDQKRAIYKALGMTLKSLSAGREKDKGSYITKSMLGNVVSSTASGLVMRANPGSQRQLGGEFVFTAEDGNDTIKCTYASRMNSTRSHSEVRDLFAAAGVILSAEDEASVFGGSSVGA
ncbi:hypothetical protein BCR35DRAFT_310361 [Leucosporidium creatinivorum]|uniref:AhpC/TSA antioxidant enzyme-domain-containing protein n=1 Tax=Leucosporidium creatinivorum TaxID=106004 RepID=A0A1Y2D591_9BASI|nr:hypothetical protein BCR35DRAFT_310361 [Leucosporidium creatinivorum]